MLPVGLSSAKREGEFIADEGDDDDVEDEEDDVDGCGLEQVGCSVDASSRPSCPGVFKLASTVMELVGELLSSRVTDAFDVDG